MAREADGQAHVEEAVPPGPVTAPAGRGGLWLLIRPWELNPGRSFKAIERLAR